MQSARNSCRSLRGSVDRNRCGAAHQAKPAVAPFAGAWIETSSTDSGCPMSRWSLPSRERGSKHLLGNATRGRLASLPSRERGSKRFASRRYMPSWKSLPSRERGSKQSNYRYQCSSSAKSLPSRERGSKQLKEPHAAVWRSRSLRGSVDRNVLKLRNAGRKIVAPFAGAWIETFIGDI